MGSVTISECVFSLYCVLFSYVWYSVYVLSLSINVFANLSTGEGLSSCAEKSGVTERLRRGVVECAERLGE